MTSFKDKVLKIVARIKKGDTLSYGEVARRAGNPKAARAVGRILNTYDSRVHKSIPCHRVIGAGGELIGYRWGLAKKRALLKREGALT